MSLVVFRDVPLVFLVGSLALALSVLGCGKKGGGEDGTSTEEKSVSTGEATPPSTTTPSATGSKAAVATADSGEGSERAEANSDISVDDGQTSYQWGSVNQGDKVEHTFSFTNTGTEPLKIYEAKGSCSCTVGKYTKEVAPGQKGTVTAAVDTARISGKTSKTVTVRTNSSKTPELRLIMAGEVLALVDVSPRNIGFGSIEVEGGKVKGSYDRSINVSSGPGLKTPLNILSVKNNDDWITVSHKSTAENSFSISVDLLEDKALAHAKSKSTDPAGAILTFSSHVVIETDAPGNGSVRVPITGVFRVIDAAKKDEAVS